MVDGHAAEPVGLPPSSVQESLPLVHVTRRSTAPSALLIERRSGSDVDYWRKRVILAGEQRPFLDALRARLATEPGIDVVAAAQTGVDAISQAGLLNPRSSWCRTGFRGSKFPTA